MWISGVQISVHIYFVSLSLWNTSKSELLFLLYFRTYAPLLITQLPLHIPTDEQLLFLFLFSLWNFLALGGCGAQTWRGKKNPKKPQKPKPLINKMLYLFCALIRLKYFYEEKMVAFIYCFMLVLLFFPALGKKTCSKVKEYFPGWG